MTAIEELIQDFETLKLYAPSFMSIDDCILLAYAALETEKQQLGNCWNEAIKAHDERGYVHARSICDFDDYYSELTQSPEASKMSIDTPSNCVHKWKYLHGSPQNETHKCLKCGAVA